jgi:hypothetical protein
MNIYLFTSDFELIKKLHTIGVAGVLHTYNAYQPNPFVTIPKNLPQTNIKHMVAVRPYTISPQLLSQISMTFDQLYGKGILQINLISGWIKENEKDAGGVLGPVNDSSSRVDRSKYLTEYVDVLESLERKTLDYYVSVTNNFTFETSAKYNSKMIIDYSHFEENRYDIKNKKVMVMMPHTASNGSLFSHEELFSRMEALSINGVQEVIFPGGDQDAIDHTIGFIKKYNNIPESTMVK